MKLNHKELIIGITIGSLLTAIPTIANTVYQATENAFNVTVNGKKAPLEGYNIGGYTYFKLRDIGEYVGFNVGFDKNTITIDTNDVAGEVSSSSSGVEDSAEDDGFVLCSNGWYVLEGQTPRDDEHECKYRTHKDPNGMVYHHWSWFDDLLSNIYLTWDDKICVIDKNTKELISDNIEYLPIENRPYISMQVFEDMILPLDK